MFHTLFLSLLDIKSIIKSTWPLFSFRLGFHTALWTYVSTFTVSLSVRAVHCAQPPFLFFFWKWINESRVFVCSDQYVVMKAALQFPAKASLAGLVWICFILYCYQPAYIYFHPPHTVFYSSWEHHGLDNRHILWRQIESWECIALASNLWCSLP